MGRPTDGTGPSAQSDQPDHRDHPDLAGIAGEMRAEWRAEQEAATDDAVAHWRHGRGLVEWCCDRMHAGDEIAVTVVEQRFVGKVEEVDADLVALRCAFGRVELHLDAAIPAAFELVEHKTHGGIRPAVPHGFRDALLAREGQAVRVGTLVQPRGIDGTLLVGRDYVSVVDRAGRETVVSLTHVVWVTAARD